MKHVGLFSLWLLICCLHGAELQETEDAEHGKDSPKSLNVPDQSQPCLPDIHAALREMSATLAEQRVRIEQLQTENQGQAAKLEKQTNEVEILKQQLQAQAAELSSIKKSSAVTENQVEVLTTERAEKKVAFSAALLVSGAETFGPFNAHTPLVFKHVVSNIGNAYNSNTGVFTAPVKGAYHFAFHMGGYGDNAHASGVVLVKNTEHIFTAYEHQLTGYGSSSNGATLVLEVGDVVFLRLWQTTKIYDNENHHNTFNGHLLFSM